MGSGRPRVLFVQGAGTRAGAERALMGRLAHLPANGIDATVAFAADGPFRDEVGAAGFATFGIPPVDHLRRPRDSARAIRSLRTAIAGTDLVEACGEKMAVLAGWAARGTGRSVVYNLQDEPLRDPRATAIQLLATAARPAHVVVPSAWMARKLASRVRISAEVIPNTLSPAELPHASADIRAEASWPADAFVVGLFGRLVAWKGAETLIRSAAQMADRSLNVRFLIAGGALYGLEPRYPERLRSLAAELGVDGIVHMSGHRENALAMMAGCDVVTHCSVAPEPFGMVVVEAMALGKPVIATRTRGPEEIVDHPRTGLLVAPGDPAALARAITGLHGDPERRAAMGLAAGADAERRFTSPATAGRLAALYRGLARPR